MDIRYCIFQLRFFGVPKERFYTYFANAIPKDWKVFVLDRAPGIPVSPAPHIEPVDMYSNEVYRRKLSVSEIEKEEQWLGHSFASIMSMEDAYFKTSYAPNMKRRMNIARHVRCFREFLTLNKINLCNVGFPNNALGITFYYVAERLKIAHWNGLEIFRGPCPDNAVLPVQYNRVVMLKKPRVSKQKMAEAKQIQRRLFEKKNYRLWEPHTKEVQVSYSMSIENFKTKFEQFKILRANQSPFESHFDMKGITQMYLEKVFRSKMNSVMMRPLLKSQKGKRYIYFPMHFTRDSTITFRNYHLDQKEIIVQAAKSLPANTYLAVKSHPNYFGSDYAYAEFKKIAQIPGVLLVDPKTSSYEMIKDALAVLTINSTAGYEALLMDKPVISLGNDFYVYKRACIAPKSLKELPEIFCKLLSEPETLYSKDDVNELVYTYFMNRTVLKEDFLSYFLPSIPKYNEQDFSTLRKLHTTVAKHILRC